MQRPKMEWMMVYFLAMSRVRSRLREAAPEFMTTDEIYALHAECVEAIDQGIRNVNDDAEIEATIFKEPGFDPPTGWEPS